MAEIYGFGFRVQGFGSAKVFCWRKGLVGGSVLLAWRGTGEHLECQTGLQPTLHYPRGSACLYDGRTPYFSPWLRSPMILLVV